MRKSAKTTKIFFAAPTPAWFEHAVSLPPWFVYQSLVACRRGRRKNAESPEKVLSVFTVLCVCMCFKCVFCTCYMSNVRHRNTDFEFFSVFTSSKCVCVKETRCAGDQNFKNRCKSHFFTNFDDSGWK